VSGNALQKVETFKNLRVVFTSVRSWNQEIDTRIGKANAILRELYCSVVMKRELSKTAKLSVFKSVCSDPHLWSWVLGDDWKNCQKIKRQRRDICKEFSVWHFVTKSTGLKSVKPGMSRHFPESRDLINFSSAMCPECLRKDWRSKSFGLRSTPKRGKRPRGRPRTTWRDYISGLAWSRLGVERAEQSEIALDCDVFSPATLLKGKPGMKMNEW